MFDKFKLFNFLTFKGSVATYLRYSGKFYMAFIVEFMIFPAAKELWKSVKVWQS